MACSTASRPVRVTGGWSLVRRLSSPNDPLRFAKAHLVLRSGIDFDGDLTTFSGLVGIEKCVVPDWSRLFNLDFVDLLHAGSDCVQMHLWLLSGRRS